MTPLDCDDAMSHVSEVFPEECAAMGGASIRLAIKRGRERGAVYGL